MTTAGKVFTVLSFLTGLAFLVFVTPVTKHLIDTQQQIEQIEKRKPPLLTATEELETKRLELTYDLNRIKDQVGSVLTLQRNQADVVQSQLSLLTDLEKAELAAVVRWQDTVRDINAEIDSRTREKERLEQEISDQENMREERQQQVDSLRDALKKARQALETTIAGNLEAYNRLERTSVPSSADDNGRIALER